MGPFLYTHILILELPSLWTLFGPVSLRDITRKAFLPAPQLDFGILWLPNQNPELQRTYELILQCRYAKDPVHNL
jgi:hypothetical protein